MTQPKRWPKVAEGARLESLAGAREIQDFGQQAKAAISQGKRDLALVYISEMQLAAKDIELQLRLCK